MSSPSTFFKTELERALSEQTFGVTSYDLKSSTAYDASASVELLEQIRIDILLTGRGFRVLSASTSAITNTNTDFETLEALLQHCSPLYVAKRTELLFAKLSA